MIRRFSSKFLITALSKGKLEFLAKQYKLEPELIEAIAEYDPASNNANTPWLCSVYKEGGSLMALEKLIEPLKKFMRLINNPEFPKEKRDIGKYTTQELLALVGNDRRYLKNLSDKEIERRIMKEGVPGASVVWDGGGFKVWKITNAKYARFLSSNTGWCTANPGYSDRYCKDGELFPIYYLGKPFCQGYVSHKGDEIEFLDKRDNAIELFAPLTLQMFEIIQIPQVKEFIREKYTSYALENFLDRWSNKDTPMEEIEEFLLKRGNPPLIATFCANKVTPVWPDGLELLLDYPQVLLIFLKEVSSEKLGTIAESHSDLAYDIGAELEDSAADDDVDAMVQIGILKGGERPLDKITRHYAEHGWELPDILLTDRNLPRVVKVVEVVMDEVKDHTSRRNRFQRFLAQNQEVTALKPVFMYFWKRYINQAWPQMIKVIGEEPQYKERMEAIKDVPRALRLGLKVVPGPDYVNKGNLSWPEDEVGVIEAISDEDVTVKLNSGRMVTVEFNPYNGVFQLQKAPAQKVKVMDPLPASLTVGMRVVPGPDHVGDRNKDQVGVVTGVREMSKNEDHEAGQLLTVDWEDGSDPYNYYYTSDIKRVVPVAVEDTRFKLLPRVLADGTKVERGPTWQWRDQDGGAGSIGTVIFENEDDRSRGWVPVIWDSESNRAQVYRYGTREGTVPPDGYSHFFLDIVPVGMSLSEAEWQELSHLMYEQYAGKEPNKDEQMYGDGDWVPEEN